MTATTQLNQPHKYFNFLSMLYCTVLTASVLLPYKIVNLFGFGEPGGIFVFPMTYLLGGVIAETYGRKVAVKMVWSSIFCLLIFNLIIFFIIRIPSISYATHQEAFQEALGSSMRLFIGCFIGLICSDLTNIYRITKLKLLFKGRYFVQRCIWSTAISEAMFNLVTYLITYYGVLPTSKLYQLMIYSWALKMIYSVIMIFPLLWLMKFLKKAEGIDIYDVKNSFESSSESILLKFLKISQPKQSPGNSENL